MEDFKDRNTTPIASIHLDLVAINTELLEQRKQQLEMEVKTLDLQARVNRLNGAVSDLTQRVELANKKKAAPGSTPKAA